MEQAKRQGVLIVVVDSNIYEESLADCTYHIKDEYFIKANNPNLMQNKEDGNFRPTFYCMRDEKTSLIWLVPLSSRVEKYQAIKHKNETYLTTPCTWKNIVFTDILRLENLMLKE